jgi:hypothetical protein
MAVLSCRGSFILADLTRWVKTILLQIYPAPQHVVRAGPSAGVLRGDPGPLGPGLRKILDANFLEDPFHALQ